MRILKWILIVLAALLLLFFFIGMPYLREQTKKHSPERTSTYAQDGFDLTVSYSSPFKKGRVIFGELVPYDVVWRTGANEPTTLETNTDIRIIDKSIPAGKYSLWTKPGKESWMVMINKEVPDWGVTISSGGRETTRDPEQDIVQVEVPVEKLTNPSESFTIDFEDGEQLYLRIYWDLTQVRVPLNK